jgi:hypothetical protein
MRSPIILCFVLLLISTASIAQDPDLQDLAVPRHAIKFSPGHVLLNYHPSVQLAYEQRIARQWTIQGEYGHILDIGSEGSERYLGTSENYISDRKGYKAKLEGRYYVVATKRGRFAWYAAGELYYNHLAYTKELTTTEFSEPDIVTVTYRQRVYNEEKGFNMKYGFVWNVGPLLVDVNAGVGYRIIHYTKLYPVFQQDDVFKWLDTTPSEESRNTPGLALGFRIGYRFPWRRPA